MKKRGCAWQFSFALLASLAIFCLCKISYGQGPLFVHSEVENALPDGILVSTGTENNNAKDAANQREFQNLYHEVAYPNISTGTAQNMTITNLTVLGVSSGTFGKVVQYVSSQTITNKNTTSSTYQSTFLGLNITPSSTSNKILIMAMGQLVTNADSVGAYCTIFNGATDLATPNNRMQLNYVVGSSYLETGAFMAWLDSPGSTTQQTYTVKIKNDNNVTTVGWGDSTAQFMIAFEVTP